MKYKYVSISVIVINMALGCALLYAEEEGELRVMPLKKELTREAPSASSVRNSTATAIPAREADAGLEVAPQSATSDIKPGPRPLSVMPARATAIPGMRNTVLQTPLLAGVYIRNPYIRSRRILQELTTRLSSAKAEYLYADSSYERLKSHCHWSGTRGPQEKADAIAGRPVTGHPAPGFSVESQREAGCVAGDSIQACIDRIVSFCSSREYEKRARAKLELLDTLGELERFLVE